MKGQGKYINHNSGDLTGRNSWDDPGFEMLLAPGDSALFGEISNFMKGLSDTEDVKSDPAYSVTNHEVKAMISDYQENAVHNKNIEKFILDSFADEAPEEKYRNEVNRIKEEIRRNNLNDISSEWIKDWNEKKKRNGNKDAKTAEIRNFITGSFKQEVIKTDLQSENRKRSGLSRSMVTRYSSLAAAAIIAAVLLIKSLIPSDDPQKIFSKYYEPFKAVSSVTRSAGAGESESFTRAITSYKSGEYQAAATGFSEAMLNGTESFSAGFFLGVTEIELGNYDKAIELLNGVVSQKSEFTKEATWYLGLAYIKSGNKVKASECFEVLARSPGFYSDRSEKILRFLR
jgi:TolA-binding protein